MKVDAYDIALIGGGFTIVGALLGALVGYWLARLLAERNALISARAKFRAAFAPAIATIYLARHHGDHDRPIVGDLLKEQLLGHASAVEEFRPFVSDRAAYQKAWEEYRSTVRQDNHAIDTEEWGTNAELWSSLESKIHAVLRFAET